MLGEPYSINNGRLTSCYKLDKADFYSLARGIGIAPGYARKAGDRPQAAMRIANKVEMVTTINTKDGSVQATSTAQPGDGIMTRLNKDGSVKLGATGAPDQWVVKAENISSLYTRLGTVCEYGDIVGAQNFGYFFELPNGGDIEAPWGGRQTTSDGVLFFSEVTGEVYLNEADGFATFVVEKPTMKLAA